MNAFTASAVSLLSKYSNNLLKDDAENALSGKVNGNDKDASKTVQTIITLIDSFADEEYLVRGLYRISGNLAAQQNALSIIENAQGTPLKLYFIYELTAEDKASCIKCLLRKMPDTLFPHSQRTAIMDISEITIDRPEMDCDKIFKALQILVYFLPDSHKRCLESLITHLAKVAAHSEENKMDINNLGLLFSSYIFPVTMDHSSMEEAKEEIARFGRLFPLLLLNSENLFHLSDELLQTLDATLMNMNHHQAIEMNINGSRFSSPFLTPNGKQSKDDPEIVMVQSCSERVPTPRRSTTEIEIAKLAAEIASMRDGPTRKKLLKKIKSDQREKLGLKQRHKMASQLFKAFTPMK